MLDRGQEGQGSSIVQIKLKHERARSGAGTVDSGGSKHVRFRLVTPSDYRTEATTRLSSVALRGSSSSVVTNVRYRYANMLLVLDDAARGSAIGASTTTHVDISTLHLYTS